MPAARTPARTAPPRTPAQNRVIWGLVGDIAAASGLDREGLAPMVEAACQAESGQTHTSRLSEPQATRVIGRLRAELGRYAKPSAPKPSATAKPAPHAPWGPRGKPRDEAEMTAFQAQILTRLFALCGYTDLRRSRAFCERQTGKPWPSTQAEADKVLTPLSEMAVRHLQIDDLRARVEALHTVHLDAWKTGFVRDLAAQLAARGVGAMSPHKLLKLLECEAAVAERA